MDSVGDATVELGNAGKLAQRNETGARSNLDADKAADYRSEVEAGSAENIHKN